MQTDSDLPYVNIKETIGHAPAKDHTEKYLRLLASYIINNTSYRLTETPEVKIQSLFNDWKYWNGVIHMAFHELSDLLQEPRYSNYVMANYDFFFNNKEVFEKQFNNRMEGASGHQFFRMDRLDDFGAMAAGLFEHYEKNNREEYLKYLNNCMDYISNGQDRLLEGTFCRNRFGYTSLWGDDLYMSIPFLVRAWKFTNDDAYLQDAIHQIVSFRNYLLSPSTGLYYHYRIMQEQVPGVAHWGRANGWMVMAQCQLLDYLPEEHKRRPQLINILKEHLTALARYQTASGMWRQLLDKSDSYLESSCTAMFTYGIAKAVNKGWISDIYTPIALAGWNALTQECIGANGYFDKVSTGFNFKQNLSYYYNVPIEPGGDHGIGAAIYAGIEIYKLKPQHRDCVWC
jgi:unsaturated rhamnogalacturonyl hydrolase